MDVLTLQSVVVQMKCKQNIDKLQNLQKIKDLDMEIV